MLTIRFDDEPSLDVRLVGGKALGLAQMVQKGLPVAPGFTVSTRAYRRHLAESGLDHKIAALMAGLDRSRLEQLDEAEATIRGWFEDSGFPSELKSEVEATYGRLSSFAGIPDVEVAVRSSATAEDAAGASFAGEYDTFVGMRGAEEVERFVCRCWASAFTARSMVYAWKNDVSPLDVDMAVVVQKAVKARAAGVMFSLSPLTGDRSRIVIEASYGLGLSVVGGEVTPDRYVVSKIGLNLIERVLGEKHIEYLNGREATPVEAERRSAFCLSDEEVQTLAQLGKTLESQHRHPVDIEFAIDRDLAAGANVILLQCRPETYWSSRHAAAEPPPVGDAAQAMLDSIWTPKTR
jgi:pyruvate,water dikinase